MTFRLAKTAEAKAMIRVSKATVFAAFFLGTFGAANAQQVAKETGADNQPMVEKKAKKKEKITDRSHPDYVRCRSEPIIGSRAKRRRVCMTNREWAGAHQEGNRNARTFVDDMQAGMDNNVGG